MIYNKKEFYGGAGLLVVFFIVLVIMFQPIFSGHNAMQYLDNLYNSISKGSVEYAPAMKPEVAAVMGKTVDLTLAYPSEAEAAQSAKMFAMTGVVAAASGTEVKVSGSLGSILNGTLEDSSALYGNDGKYLEDKYGLDARRPVYNWWTSLKLMDKALKKQKEFASAKLANTVQKKVVEAAYNYYGVEPVHIMDKLGLVIFSLAFYVFYTLWYGFAILFVFEGWGLRLSH
ncbi:hypothetical protein GM415_09605 [Pseudodesulfovibrio cashew]|uniref:Uncharacterized protein n=1 Tax=Pseudodesulfovibrio cashew TaxID=2678688 RepID=A0A6I6JJ85_9BACT|nr:hypothetical protein [Pseudodesulfovibrio cashew]QGY40372.1 hypothetical protein GM415_09605 [Pseudodesulfovibrio cashew]